MTTVAAAPYGIGGTGLVIGGAVILTGWSVREATGGAPAVARIRDGDTNGTIVATIGLAAGADDTHSTGAGGLGLEGGLFFQVVAGAIEGSVWAVPLTGDKWSLSLPDLEWYETVSRATS